MQFDGLSDAKTEGSLPAIAQNSPAGTGLLNVPEADAHEVNAAAAYLAELHSAPQCDCTLVRIPGCRELPLGEAPLCACRCLRA